MSNSMNYALLNVENTFYKNKYKKIPKHIENLKVYYSEFKKIIEKNNNNNNMKNEAQGIVRIIYHDSSVYSDYEDENRQKVDLNFSFESIFDLQENVEASIIIVEDPNSFNCNNSDDLMKKFREIHKNNYHSIKVVFLGRLTDSHIKVPSNINTNKKESKKGKQTKRNYALFLQLQADNICLISQPYTLMCTKQFSHTSETRKNSFFKNLLNDENIENIENINYYYNLIFKDNENKCEFKSKFNYKIKLFKVDRTLMFDSNNNKPTIEKMIDILEIFNEYNKQENHFSNINYQLPESQISQSCPVQSSNDLCNNNSYIYQYFPNFIPNNHRYDENNYPDIFTNESFQSSFQTNDIFNENQNKSTFYLQLLNNNQEIINACLNTNNIINYYQSYISHLQVLNNNILNSVMNQNNINSNIFGNNSVVEQNTYYNNNITFNNLNESNFSSNRNISFNNLNESDFSSNRNSDVNESSINSNNDDNINEPSLSSDYNNRINE
ncbi:hypothetical protein PIROE2DRAFT_6449 [Piromyces sp. E2]|nr:hypothetical protein PIROE2DRAFT_6449 [Piromyces sp. E2]|eukprot:OUM66315.1 hypothetical protein PIROE2DRAFT_6449 [Piromyces sp. E2]